ncbi:MAG: glycoside hydrolase family 3 protein, partial [Ruminococcus sp.]|nr:glycoside hydrolase family 3 protein [Ruminococcus sp.]
MAKLNWNEYIEKAVQVNAEGAVLVRNQGGLPLDKSSETAVFGRIQLDYYKSGTGSGGMVNVTKVTGITDGLIEAGAKLNEELLQTYRDWFAENPHDFGEGWGGEPWCQKEMPVSDELAAKAAQTAQAALVVIGRTAGEEQDNSNTAGSYKLTDDELEMLKTVRKHFKRMIVVLNVGNIIDMSFVDEFEPEAVLYIWQGGMTGGTGAARVLLGEVSPSGKLPDTIAYDVTDYPSDKYFHNTERNFYTEDIYVGYRWFETFAKEKVRYPFGFGLSYTDFEISASGSYDGEKVTVTAAVKNIGNFAGKEVVQVYCEAPQGKLGKPSRVLCGFEKTKELAPGEEQTLTITVEERKFASYDDSGVTGFPYAWVLEQGVYKIFAGSDVRDAEEICAFKLNETELVQQLSQALAPVMEFERIVNKDGSPAFEKVPLSKIDEKQRRNELMPEEIAFTGDRGFKLADVKNGKCTLDEFIAQLDDTDLNVLVRGEGMCSPKVTPGTAAAFGGVSEHLKQMGVPCGCCSDGPSGMRLDTGTKAFSLPNGTLIASTFNKPLVQELFAFLGLEMRANNVDCLLGPGMNIHRHPLNGRNFEYFSEDPYLTGVMAASELRGLHSQGVEGTIKHFCGNNQETNRHFLDSAISERALREIYLRGFEMAVKCGKNRSVMTTYGKVNDLWTAGSFDLDTVILRQQWGFDGFAMTDWWANINDRG